MNDITRCGADNLFSKLMPTFERLLSLSGNASGDLAKVEEALESAMKAIRSEVVNAALEASCRLADSDFNCPKCRKRLTGWGSFERNVVTSQGEGSLKVQRFRCRACKVNFYPLLTLNGLENTQYTIGARHFIAAESTDAPFARTALRMERHAIPVSASEVDQISREVGCWRKEEEEAVRSFLVLKGRDLPLPLHDVQSWERSLAADAAIVLSVDGAKVRSPVNDGQSLEWFEVRAAAMETTGPNTPKISIAGVLETDKLFETLWSQSRQVIRNHKNKMVFVADGGNWIWDRVGHWFPKAIQVLDIYHAGEHVASAARACWGERSEQAGTWTREARSLLLSTTGVRGLLRQLVRQWREGNIADMAQLRTEFRYLWKHRCRMNYAWLKGRGLPIGSGIIESTVKQTSTYRLRQAGMMWSKAGADNMLRLRAAELSGSLKITIVRQHAICKNRMSKYAEAV
jgi:hypothetical protein